MTNSRFHFFGVSSLDGVQILDILAYSAGLWFFLTKILIGPLVKRFSSNELKKDIELELFH